MNRRFIFTVLTSTLLILITIFACEKKPTAPVRENPFDPKTHEELPPIAKFTAIKDIVNYRLYHFDASPSTDYEDGHNLLYRWDFDGNGIWDTDWLTQDTISYEYANDGSYTVKLNVRDQKRLIGEKEKSINVSWIEMVYVKGGSFEMGCTSEQNSCNSDENPVHTVRVNSFYISKYEVTQAQYQEIMGNNPSYFKGGNRPVDQVSWYDAVNFCNKLSKRKGLEPCYTINGTDVICDFSKNGYRLPTEAEWEYAARGGSTSSPTLYAGSNNVDDVAWYYGNSGGHTHEVGTKQPNELGLYDMSGNVAEWCWDWYTNGYYSFSPQDNPKGPASGIGRVLRGGCWSNTAIHVRVADRNYTNPGGRGKGGGFRILRAKK